MCFVQNTLLAINMFASKSYYKWLTVFVETDTKFGLYWYKKSLVPCCLKKSDSSSSHRFLGYNRNDTTVFWTKLPIFINKLEQSDILQKLKRHRYLPEKHISFNYHKIWKYTQNEFTKFVWYNIFLPHYGYHTVYSKIAFQKRRDNWKTKWLPPVLSRRSNTFFNIEPTKRFSRKSTCKW